MPFDKQKFAAQLRRQRRKIRGVEYSEPLAADYAIQQIRIVRYITRLARAYLRQLIGAGLVRDALPTFLNYIRSDDMEWIAKQEDAVAVNAVRRIDKFHRNAFIREFKTRAGIDLTRVIREERLDIPLNNKIRENIELITKANTEQLDRLESVFKSTMMAGEEKIALESAIANIGDVFESRAKLIARDQTSKMLGELNKERQLGIGIRGYYWRTVGDERVRDEHAELEGEFFSWGSPPSIGHPGEDIQCRCVADPAIDDFLSSIPDE